MTNQLRTLEAADIVNILNGAVPHQGTVQFQTHALDGIRERISARIPFLRRLTADSPDEGIVQLTGHLLTWNHLGSRTFLALAHVREATVTDDRRVMIHSLSGRQHRLPRLCRPVPLAALINALITGAVNPDAAHRPACINCAHLGGDQRCNLENEQARPGVCCPSRPHQDWCPQHQPTTG